MNGASLVRAVLRGPFTGRARREVAFCVLTLPFGVFIPLAGFFVTVDAGLLLGAGPPWVADGNPSGQAVAAAVGVAALLALLLVMTGAARGLTTACRELAGWLLGERVAAPAPLPGRGLAARLAGGLADGPGWRALAYLLLKLPVMLLELYAVAVFWGAGLANLTYPFWWQSFRNHSPGTQLSAVPVITPFDWLGQGQFTVTTFTGTFAAFAAGAGLVLAAPWVTRAVVAADRRLIRGLLSPGSSARRLADLERTRALAVDDAAARLRRLERDLHDGAQIRLATLAMNLGMAKKKLGDSGAVPDADAARELVDTALRGARDALGELRELARGIHPPVLDNGLPDALASVAASSAIPAQLACRLPDRPAPAIEAIAYFCAAELLANAAKHSAASTIEIDLSERAGRLMLTVADDGRGGADAAAGSGLAGLAERAAVVDGSLTITSPPGGPTRVTVEIPLHA
ncbi:MAG TPA: sensor domain-containing protein [Streptosporangiaceae bacterium]